MNYSYVPHSYVLLIHLRWSNGVCLTILILLIEKNINFLHTYYTLVSYTYHLRPNVMIKIAQGLTFRVTLQWEIFESQP